jgi:hypothetical protein
MELCIPVSSPYLVRLAVEVPYLVTLPRLVALWGLAIVAGSSISSGSWAADLAPDPDPIRFDNRPLDPNDEPWFEEAVIGIRTVLGYGAGVLKSSGLSGLAATCSLGALTELDKLVVRRSDDDPGVPLNRTTRRGYGLWVRDTVAGDAVCSRTLCSGAGGSAYVCLDATAVDPDRLCSLVPGIGDAEASIDASSFNNAFVRALNFIGTGRSSSELSLSENRGVLDVASSAGFSLIATSLRRKFGLAGACCNACLDTGRRIC